MLLIHFFVKNSLKTKMPPINNEGIFNYTLRKFAVGGGLEPPRGN